MPTYRLLTPAGSVPLAGKEITIGSSPDCPARAEGPEVASHHARVMAREGALPLVEPLSPTCQVFIDGEAVAGQAELAPGQILRVGSTEFQLELSSAEEEPAARKRPLWRRLVRAALYAAGALLLLVVLALVLAPFILSETRVKGILKDHLEKQFRRDVSIGGVELQLLHGLKIRDLRVENKEGFSTDKPFLTVKEIDVRAAVWPFLRSRFRRLNASVTVRDPAVYLERDAKTGQLNTAGMFEGEPEKKAGGAPPKPARKGSGGPLGPIQNLDFRLALENGALRFDDHARKAEGRIEGLNIKADVTDFNVPDLAGKFNYDVSLAAPHGPHPGKVSVRGATQFDLDVENAAGKNALGLVIKALSGEMANVSVNDLDLEGLARCFGFPTPGPTSLMLVVTPVSASPLTIKVSGWVDTPQIDAVSLGLNDKPVPGLGAKVSIEGLHNLESGTGSLTVSGESGLWQKLSADVRVESLPAAVLVEHAAAKPASSSGKIKVDIIAAADIGKLTGGEVGKLFRASDRIDGAFQLAVKAEGPVTDLPVSVDLSLKGLTVPKKYTGNQQLPAEDMGLNVAGRLSLDPEKLIPRQCTFGATVTSAAVDGKLTNGIYSQGKAHAPGQLGGEVTFKANWKRVLDRYGKILPLPDLNEELTVTASARSEQGPIALRAEIETRQVGAKPDPIRVTASAIAEVGADWNFRNVVVEARTPESPSLDFRASGQVLKAFSAPEFNLAFSQKTDLAALWGRLGQLIKTGGTVAKLDVRGQLNLTGGEVKGTAAALSSKLSLDLTNLEITGFGKDGKESLKDAKVRLDLNADLEPGKRRLAARTVSLTSSICNLNLSGEVTDWSALLGKYQFNLDADAEKTIALLRALEVFREDLQLKGKAVVALTADTGAGTASVERCLIDTDLAKVRITGGLKGLQVDKLMSTDRKRFEQALDALNVDLAVEECRTDVEVLSKLRGLIPAIPAELSGSGPVVITARASGSKGRIAVGLNFDASEAAVAFTGLINKPAKVPATVKLDGELAPEAKDKALVKINKLDVRLGDLALAGSGSSALDLSAVQVSLNVPKFAPESLRAMFPPLADFTFGGKVELTGLNVSGNVRAVLDSKEDVFTGRLAGLTFGGRAVLDQITLEYHREMPHMKARANGAIQLDTGFVQIDGLSAGVIHKRTQQETSFSVAKGRVTSAVKGGRLLTNLHKLSAELAVSSPEVKVQEILAAIETPAGTAPPAVKPPAGPNPPAGKAPGPAKPYEFLAGYLLAGKIDIGRVSYVNYVVTDLSGSMTMQGNVFKVYDFKAKAYKGDVAGNITADLNVPGIAHGGEIKPSGVDVDTAATEIMAYKDIFHGKASGTVAWTGVGIKPDEILALDGKAQLRYENGLVRNIDKFPPLREAVGSLGQLFLPALVQELRLSEFKLAPVEMNLNLAADDKKPVIRTTGTAFRTVEADPLEVGASGGISLLADAKGEYPFVPGTRLTLTRVPDRWLDKINFDALLPKEARGGATSKPIRAAVQKGAKDGKIFQRFSGTVQNPKVEKLAFVGELLKDVIPGLLKGIGLDILKKKLLGGDDGDKDEPKKNPLEDLFKKLN